MIANEILEEIEKRRKHLVRLQEAYPERSDTIITGLAELSIIKEKLERRLEMKAKDICFSSGMTFEDEKGNLLLFDDCDKCSCNVVVRFKNEGASSQEMATKEDNQKKVIGMYYRGKCLGKIEKVVE